MCVHFFNIDPYFSSGKVQFVVVRGDITSDYKTTVKNVISKIDNLLKKFHSRYEYTWNDYIRIIHIVDTDGAFAKDCIEKQDVKEIEYYEDHIAYYNPDEVKRRNTHKSEILHKLYTTKRIHMIPYQIYYNSCNLEHVLFKELKNFTDEEKTELSDLFADQYEGKVSDFIKFISDTSFAVTGTYKETWEYITKDTNSLQRHTNMHLIFTEDDIDRIIYIHIPPDKNI